MVGGGDAVEDVAALGVVFGEVGVVEVVRGSWVMPMRRMTARERSLSTVVKATTSGSSRSAKAKSRQRRAASDA